MTHPSKRLIVAVLDRSGSMVATRKDAEGGFDTLIAEQRKEPFETAVTLTQFDTVFESVYNQCPIGDVPPLKLEPRGMTALFDAVGKTINDVGAQLAGLPDHERPAKVFFVVITDGAENSSKEFTGKRVKEMIEHQREKYGWQFTFIGSDLTTMDLAAQIGIPRDRALVFSANAQGTNAAYRVASRAISHSSHTGDAIAYSGRDRQETIVP